MRRVSGSSPLTSTNRKQSARQGGLFFVGMRYRTYGDVFPKSRRLFTAACFSKTPGSSGSSPLTSTNRKQSARQGGLFFVGMRYRTYGDALPKSRRLFTAARAARRQGPSGSRTFISTKKKQRSGRFRLPLCFPIPIRIRRFEWHCPELG